MLKFSSLVRISRWNTSYVAHTQTTVKHMEINHCTIMEFKLAEFNFRYSTSVFLVAWLIGTFCELILSEHKQKKGQENIRRSIEISMTPLEVDLDPIYWL